MADQQSATQLHPQQRLETSNFKFHQQYNFCEKAKPSKQNLRVNDNRAGETSSWVGKHYANDARTRCFYLIYSYIE